MHHFLGTLIEPLLYHLQPQSIVEIGSGCGLTTSQLLAFCESHGSVLHAIDPWPQFDVAAYRERYGESFVCHRSLSLNALPRLSRPDIVLIDGDPNWYTVFHELQLIEKCWAQGATPFPVVLLHNTGWPYGRRDCYTHPDTIPPAYRHAYKRKGLLPGVTTLQERGGLHPHRAHAIEENTERNGVRTALEDFLKITEQQLECVHLADFFGLDLVYPARLKTQPTALASFLQEHLISRAAAPDREQYQPDHQDWLAQEIQAQLLHEEQVCIIILNRNGAQRLQELLASFVVHNTYPHVSFLIVDHASSDDSLAVVQSFQAELSISIISCGTNYSFSYANNRAAEQAEASYLLFLNNDIIFPADVLSTLVGHLRNSLVGLVGVTLLYPDSHPTFPGQPQHVGIRFAEEGERPGSGPPRPYELGAKSGLHCVPNRPEIYPAVTAAALLCRRDEFLSLGGFHEDYRYGYEDVDLGLSYLLQLGKVSLSANECSLIHNEGATRRDAARGEARRRRENNRQVFAKRYGAVVNAALQSELFGSEKFWSERIPVVVFALPHKGSNAAAWDTAQALAAQCAADYGWNVRVLTPDHDWYALEDVDALLVTTRPYDLKKIRCAKPTLITIAWLLEPVAGWTQQPGQSSFDAEDFRDSEDSYEMYLYVAEHDAEILVGQHRQAVQIFPPVSSPHQAARLRTLLLDVCQQRLDTDRRFNKAMHVVQHWRRQEERSRGER